MQMWVKGSHKHFLIQSPRNLYLHAEKKKKKKKKKKKEKKRFFSVGRSEGLDMPNVTSHPTI